MDMRICRRVRAFSLTVILIFSATARAQAATLVLFDFDDTLGQFETTPTLLHAGVGAAAWSDDLGRLTDSGGNPGRALAASGFPGGNTLHLALALEPGLSLELARLRFDVRASASGPTAWTVAIGGLTVLSGQTTTAFTTVDELIAAPRLAGSAQLDIHGSGATSAAGVLRLDNVELFGALTPVPLPGPLFLLLTPLLGLVMSRVRRRYLDTRDSGVATLRSA